MPGSVAPTWSLQLPRSMPDRDCGVQRNPKFPCQKAKASTLSWTDSSLLKLLGDATRPQGSHQGPLGSQGWESLTNPRDACSECLFSVAKPGAPSALMLGLASDSIVAGQTGERHLTSQVCHRPRLAAGSREERNNGRSDALERTDRLRFDSSMFHSAERRRRGDRRTGSQHSIRPMPCKMPGMSASCIHNPILGLDLPELQVIYRIKLQAAELVVTSSRTFPSWGLGNDHGVDERAVLVNVGVFSPGAGLLNQPT